MLRREIHFSGLHDGEATVVAIPRYLEDGYFRQDNDDIEATLGQIALISGIPLKVAHLMAADHDDFLLAKFIQPGKFRGGHQAINGAGITVINGSTYDQYLSMPEIYDAIQRTTTIVREFPLCVDVKDFSPR